MGLSQFNIGADAGITTARPPDEAKASLQTPLVSFNKDDRNNCRANTFLDWFFMRITASRPAAKQCGKP